LLFAQGDSLVAEACVHYAMAFNSLDVDWLIGVISPAVKYESQSVFAALVGRNKVMSHLRGKIESIRCWRRLKTDHPYRLKIDQGELLNSVLYSIGIVDQTELVLPPFFY